MVFLFFFSSCVSFIAPVESRPINSLQHRQLPTPHSPPPSPLLTPSYQTDFSETASDEPYELEKEIFESTVKASDYSEYEFAENKDSVMEENYDWKKLVLIKEDSPNNSANDGDL